MAKTGKPPAFQMYASDFYMDTQELNVCEVGAYTRLLMVQWVNGSLPREHERLASMCGMELEAFEMVWPKFRKKFIDYGDGGSRYINARLKETRDNLDKLRVVKSNGGKKGADIRWDGHMEAKEKLTILAEVEAEKNGTPVAIITGKEVIQKVKKLFVDVEYAWPDQRFKDAWAAWIQYKKHTFKFKYKDALSETRAINLLYKQFSGNLEFVLEAIELSMARQWQGVHADWELKKKYAPKPNNTNDTSSYHDQK